MYDLMISQGPSPEFFVVSSQLSLLIQVGMLSCFNNTFLNCVIPTI